MYISCRREWYGRSVVLVFVAGVVLAPAMTTAQTNPTTCSWSGRSIPVYFNPANIAANGFDENAFRNTMLNAMAVWNEESRGDIDMYYAGDTTETVGIAGAILVSFWNWLGGSPTPQSCAAWGNTLANTALPSGTSCNGSGSAMAVGLRSVCVPEPSLGADGHAWLLVARDADQWRVIDTFSGTADAVRLRGGEHSVDEVLESVHAAAGEVSR